MAVDHEKIQQLLDEKEAPADHSLRANALRRARADEIPKTLTAYEWEEWYAERGIPDSHRVPQVKEKKRKWRRVFRCLFKSRKGG